MFYYWLIAVLVVAIIAIWFFFSSARHNTKPDPPSKDPEPIRRGRFVNEARKPPTTNE